MYTLRMELSILGLTGKEEKVLLSVQEGHSTVVDIAAYTKVSRPSVYDILKKLKRRGLVMHKTDDGKKRWYMENERKLTDNLYLLKKKLLSFVDGKEEAEGVTDGTVTVHRGDEAIRNAIWDIFSSRKNERFQGYMGFDQVAAGWETLFTMQEISTLNKMVKENKIITESIFPKNWVENMFAKYGEVWAKDYEGRTASSVYVDVKYFHTSGQLFAFKDVMYLLALKDKMIIEIRHSDIQKMILGMYSFMKDNGEVIDINKRLRDLIARN